MAGDWNNSREGERSGSPWRSASSHRKGGRSEGYQRREDNGGRRYEDRRDRGYGRYDDRREGRYDRDSRSYGRDDRGRYEDRRGGRYEDRRGGRYSDRREDYGRSNGRFDRGSRNYEDRREGRYEDRRDRGYGRYDDRREDRYDRDSRSYGRDDRGRYEDRRGGRYEDRRGGRYSDRREDYGRSNGRFDRGGRNYDDRREDRWDDRRDNRGRYEDRRGRGDYSQQRDSRTERHNSYENRFNNEENRRFDDRRDRGNKGYGRPRDPMIPEEISARDLDPESRRHLSSLTKDMADKVARHLVYAGAMMDVNPELAYEHARAAYRHAARIDIVREALGLAAYLSGRYSEALRELRTYRRMTEDYSHVAIEADSERGLGRAEKALAFIAEIPLKKLDPEAQIELVLVTSGARADVGDSEGGLSALEHLKVENLDDSLRSRVELIRADRLEELGRQEEAEALRQEWSPVYDAEVSIGEVEEEEGEDYLEEETLEDAESAPSAEDVDEEEAEDAAEAERDEAEEDVEADAGGADIEPEEANEEADETTAEADETSEDEVDE